MPNPAKCRVEQQRDNQHSVIELKNAQRAADVEVAKAVRGVAGVVENTGNEKTGQNEEDVYSSPTPRNRRPRAKVIVRVEDHEYSKCAHAVERRVELLVLGSRQPDRKSTRLNS